MTTPLLEAAFWADKRVAEGAINLDWQWRSVKEDETKVIISTVINKKQITLYRGGDDNYTLLTCLHERLFHQEKDHSLEWLIHGQRHNPPVQNLYSSLYHDMGDIRFWRLVCVASRPEHVPDWEEVEQNIKWQKLHSSDTIENARQAFGEDKKSITGIYWLLLGQKHNIGSMTSYRLAAKENLERLYDLLH